MKIPAAENFILETLDSLELHTEHSDKAMSEADHWLANPGHDDPTLDDLTALPFVTIDNPDSRDLDQALYIEETADGYRLRYALADAAYYVRPDSALFDEALQRGATFYTPLLAVPMLPSSLSEGLVSLNPNVNRRALVFDIRLNHDASVQQTRVVRALICSQAKLSYGGVQDWLNTYCSFPQLDSERALMNCKQNVPDRSSQFEIKTDTMAADVPYRDSLKLLQVLGEKLISNSARRGVVPFDRSETAISVDATSHQFRAERRHRYMTEQYNEQISLLCNMQGAELLMALQGHSDALQAIYRVHDAPLSKNSKRLRQTLDALIETQQLDNHWRWQENSSLAQYVRNLPDDKASHRLKATIQRLIMQAQRASVFQPEPDIHHALKAAAYARFSSPMREIVGIFTHKELLEALTMEPSEPASYDETLRAQVISAANRARQTQRQLDKRIEFAVIQSVLGSDLNSANKETYSATIIGLRKDRLYAAIDGLALDFKIYKDDLDEQFSTHYEINQTQATPADKGNPSWLLGQGIHLSARRYDSERKRFLFTITADNHTIE